MTHAFSSTALVPLQQQPLQRATVVDAPSDSSAFVSSFFRLSDAALKNGIHIVAGPGAGKSRLIGRALGWQQMTRRKPQVILDPTGGVVDNLLDKIVRLPIELRRKLWPRINYIDMGATDYIVPSPLYYQISPTDTPFAIANRFPSLLKRLDPDLASAPILGWNSLYECSIYAGQIAAALGRQIDFVADLIAHPKNYKIELKQALSTYPDLQPAVDYFRELMDPTSGELRNRRTGSFVNKLIPFLSDPTMQAAFAAPERQVDWEEVVRQGQTVLIDFRHEVDPDRRRFKLLYWFRDFVDYVKHRGMGGRGAEVLLIIDEVTQLLGQKTMTGQSMMAEDLEELVAVLGRNMGVNVVIAHQNLSQVELRVMNVLMQMGTQIVGVISNPDDALLFARQLVPYDPYRVKKREPVWMSLSKPGLFGSVSEPTIIDYTTTEFTPDEQQIMAASRFQRLGRFRFLVRPAISEGNITGKLKQISIEQLDYNQYPDARTLAEVRSFLRQKWGIPMETLLSEIRARRAGEGAEEKEQKQVKSSRRLDILKGEEEITHATTSHHLPESTNPIVPIADPANTRDSVSKGSGPNDGFWQ